MCDINVLRDYRRLPPTAFFDSLVHALCLVILKERSVHITAEYVIFIFTIRHFRIPMNTGFMDVANGDTFALKNGYNHCSITYTKICMRNVPYNF